MRTNPYEQTYLEGSPAKDAENEQQDYELTYEPSSTVEKTKKEDGFEPNNLHQILSSKQNSQTNKEINSKVQSTFRNDFFNGEMQIQDLDLNTPAEILSKPETISSFQEQLSDYVSNANDATSNINDKSMAQ